MKFCKKIAVIICIIAILISALPAAAEITSPEIPKGYDGFAAVSAEAFTLGMGYIVEPTLVPFHTGESIAVLLDRVFAEKKLEYKAGGSVEKEFYLQSVQCEFEKSGETPAVPEFLMKELTAKEGQWTGEANGDGMLEELEYSAFGGWLIADNDAGTADYASALPAEAKHIYRCMFSVYGYGMDLGLNDGFGMFPAFENPAAGVSRTEASILYANIRADKALSEAVSEKGAANAEFEAFKAALENLASSQKEIDESAAALKEAVEKAAEAAAVPAAEAYKAAYSGVLSYLSEKAPRFGAAGGEWLAFTMARSGKKSEASEYFTDYYKNIEETVKQNGNAVLNERKPTENARLIIALSGIGRDARAVAGFDLIEPLLNFDYAVKQGVAGAAYSLIALESADEAVSDKAISGAKTKLADWLLSEQNAEGGWSPSGAGVDADITAMAITALSPYEKEKTAVEKGINALSKIQQADGGFLNSGESNADSAAQVVIALSSAGIDAASDARFVKNGNSALSALLNFYSGGGFSHLADDEINEMATEQAACALCAYDRFLNGKVSLFDMTDVKPSAAPAPAPSHAPAQNADKPEKKLSAAELILVIAAAALALMIILFIIRKVLNSRKK